MKKITVLGAGSWGSALALQLTRLSHQVILWGRDEMQMQTIATTKQNPKYLPNITFPDQLIATNDLELACKDADLLLCVVPSKAFADLLQKIRPFADKTPIMWAIKGFESKQKRLLNDVFNDYFPKNHPHAILAGPSFAKEVAQNLPTAVTISAPNSAMARQFATYFHRSNFLCYISTDMIGVQIGGAVKNVIAIACGIADGIGAGANARSALITRGLTEMTRLAVTLGGLPKTLQGLSGLGDLCLTATDNQSRNRQFGLLLGQGMTINAAINQIGQVVEGIDATNNASALAEKLQIHMPITQTLQQMLQGKISLEKLIKIITNREIKDE